jgi:ketosteroid isomerase-like protein
MAKPKPKLHIGTPDDVETTFYDALEKGDIDLLMSCWGDEDDIFCILPGGPRVVGHGAIRAAFDAIFTNGSIHAHPERIRRVQTLNTSVHSVIERVEVLTEQGPQQAHVLATNIFLKTPQGWHLVAHHASPGTPYETPEVSDSPSVLH